MTQQEKEKMTFVEYFEEEKMPPAEFFKEETSNPLNPSDQSQKNSFATPLNKIKMPLSEKKLNVCLYLIRKFCPIHNNHLRALEKSKEKLETLGYNVIGGFICPSHESSVKKKFGKSPISFQNRHTLCKLAVKDSDWINIDPFLMHAKSNVDAVSAKSHLEDTLRDKIQRGTPAEVQVVSVGGDDELFRDQVVVVKDIETPYSISSAKLREMIKKRENYSKFLPQAVYEFIIKNKITFGGITQQDLKPKESKPAAIRINQEFVGKSLEELIKFEYKNIPWSELHSLEEVVLGTGVSAQVCAMKWKEELVAVKLYLLGEQENRTIATFKRDLRALVSIKHKNVVKCLGAGSHKNALYIVMERAQPLNIWNYLQKVQKFWKMGLHPICWIKVWAELAEGLQAMSDAGILHRDLHGDNLLVFFEKEEKDFDEKSQEALILKVTDFGVSSFQSDKDRSECKEDKMNYVPASDVYSFALLLMQIMRGKPVWSVDNARKHTLARKRPKLDFPCYDEVREVIELCWQQDPDSSPIFGKVAKMLQEAYEKLNETPPVMENLVFNLEGENRSILDRLNKNNSDNEKLTIPVIKSAIQKYIRRGIFSQALYWTMLLLNNSGLRTNMINRLTLIVTEDVSLSEWWLVFQSDILLNEIRKYPLDQFNDADVTAIVKLIYYLCEARKSRVISHLNSFFDEKSSQKERYPERFPTKDENLNSYLGNKMLKPEDRCRAFSFVKRQSYEELKEFLEKYAIDNDKLRECVKILIERYKKLKQEERWRYLYHAFLLILYEDLLDWELKPKEPQPGYLAAELKKVQDWINTNEPIKPDEFVLDMHTKRKEDRTPEDKKYFWKHGATVENPCKLMTFKFYQNFYENR